MIWRLSGTSNPAAATGMSTRYGYVLSFVSDLPVPQTRFCAAVFMCTPPFPKVDSVPTMCRKRGFAKKAGSGGKRRARSFCQGLAKGKQGLVAPTCLLSPFPLAGSLVVVGKTALDHIAAPLIARHDEGSETAAAEAKRAKRHHNDDLQPQLGS
jgi:hypothetical protein